MDHYVIRIDGAVPRDALAGFEDLSVSAVSMQTELSGDLPDQAALAGVLDRLDELGAVIVEVWKVPSEPGRAAG
jgi:hypothetical protein